MDRVVAAANPRVRVLAAVLVLAAASLASSAPTAAPGFVSVIVRGVSGGATSVGAAIERVGGVVGLPLDLLDGYAAGVPRASLASLAADPAVRALWPDQRVSYAGASYSASSDVNSMFRIVRDVVNADSFWASGYTGAGIDVALIDTGVVPVNGLRRTGKVIDGPDLSFESQFPQTRHLDTFGHGTHMAGIIAGRDDAAPSTPKPSSSAFQGIAPRARLVNVKVADAQGRTDVSQVIAAIDWVIKHRSDKVMGLNIRVLNLAFGTDGLQPYATDPLTYAVEQAWKAGIVVVVAAGNSSFGNDELNNPATDPYVIAVGAAQTNGTNVTSGHSVPSWSGDGTILRAPDLVAPGKSIQSLRNTGSAIDVNYPSGVIDGRFFRGSGTSQATAIVSGAAALLLQQRPSLNPDQVKSIFRSTARSIPSASSREQGAGLLDLHAAKAKKTPSVLLSKQVHAPATGLGSLEAARGTVHVVENGVALVGSQDIFAQGWDLLGRIADLDHSDDLYFWWNGGWDAVSWSGRSWSGRSWTGNDWTGRSWSGRSWSGDSWNGSSWEGRSWSSSSWEGRSWSSNTWSSEYWGNDPA